MKRLLPVFFVFFVVLAFAGTVVFLWQQSQEEPVVFETTQATIMDVVKKTVATGAINPRTEVAIKPAVSGIVSALQVEPGDTVARGDLIAEIRLVPDSMQLNNAEGAVRSAELSLRDAQRELERTQALQEQGVLSAAELDRTKTEYQLRKEDRDNARTNLQLLRDGVARGSAHISTQVRATVSGMVLEVPVEVGESVIESNTFNEGTTIASVADMTDLIFQGTVDESEVGKLKAGMPLAVTIAAYQGTPFQAELEYIAPKGVLDRGAVQFEIRAAMALDGIEPDADGTIIRAGCSANADIVLDRRDQVLAIEESLLVFDDGKPVVEVEVGQQQFERRSVELGLSDGIHVEVLSGVTQDLALKRQDPGSSDSKRRRRGPR